MIKFLNNISLEAGNDIQFKTTAGANAGKISQDGNNLVLTNAVGDILLGDGSADVYIGDGTNSVDIIFEQSGSIKGDGSAVTLTLGGSNTTLNLENPNINGSVTLPTTTINSKMTFGTSSGYILFDYEPSGDTGQYASEVPLIKVGHGSNEHTILARLSEYRTVVLGQDDTVWLQAGDTRGVITSNVNLTTEQILMSAEGGFHAYGFPGNDTNWSNRVEFKFRTDSTTAGDNGLYIGDGGNTQFIDLSRNLSVGTISSGAITSTGNLTVTKGSATIKVEESGGADVRMAAGGSTGYIGTYSNDQLYIQQNGSPAITIDTSRNSTFTGSITTNLSSEGTYFTGGSGGLRQLSITSGTNTSAHALHTFNIASSNGKYEFDVNGTTELSLDSSSATFAGTIAASNLSGTNTGDQTLPTASSLGAVTLTGTQTISGTKTFSGSSNQHNGHIFYNSYDAAGNHYPHFKDGSSNSGTTINWRQYYGSSQKTHTWTSDSSGNMLFTYQGGITATGALTGTSLDINGNADIAGELQVTTDGTATLILRGDNNNSGDTGQLDSTIKMLHDDGTHGILMETKNFAGKQRFEIKSLVAGTESSRFLIHEDNYITTSGAVTVGGELEATSLDIAGNADISGTITSATWGGDVIPEAKLQNQSGTNTGDQNLSTYAPLASPTFTGTPRSVTPAANTNTTQIATTAYVQTELTDLIGGAPGTLDTLNELAAAINDDASYASTLTTALATKLPLAGGTLTGGLTIDYAAGTTNPLLSLFNDTNGGGAKINFSDQSTPSQNGTLMYVHSDGASYGTGNAFVFSGTETSMNVVALGNLVYRDGIYKTPSSGTGAGTRKDANWDTAYTHSQAAHAPSNANNYVHPTTAGNKHIPTGGSSGQFLRYSSSGTATWATPDYIANTNTHTHLDRTDNRTISPNEYSAGDLNFGFTSWGNNNTSPYADFLHLRSYTDSSGGADNMVMFKKSGVGMRIWQQNFGSSTAYSDYEDVWHTGNLTTTNKANYDTAYGWGDHSTAGYAASSHTHSYDNYGSWNLKVDGVQKTTVTSGGTLDIQGGTNVTTTYGAGGRVTITSTDTDTVYTHPTTAGNKHVPTGGSAGQFLKYSSSGTAVWAADNNTTYSVGDGGLTQKNFTTTLKTKLDGIATNANNYTLPFTNNSSNWNTAHGWGNHQSAGYATTTTLNGTDRSYITDSRGAARAPSYYDDRYAQWDFQNVNDTGVGGDGWHALLTVAKWSSYDASHRQEQLIFSGNDLFRRTASSDSAWGTSKKIYDSGNLTNVAKTNVANNFTTTQKVTAGDPRLNLVSSTSPSLTAGIGTQVGGRLLSFGTNYSQTGTSTTAYAGGFFRIDTRVGYEAEFFTVQKAAVTTGTQSVIFRVKQDGDVGITGDLGIGTTSPLAALDVRGTLRSDQEQDTAPGGTTGVGEIGTLIGDAGPDDTALGTPNKWLKITLSGNDYLIPAYAE